MTGGDFFPSVLIYRIESIFGLIVILGVDTIPKRIKVAKQARCIGCYSCMMACARSYYKSISLKNSAIDIRTSGGIESAYVSVVCHACIEPPCAKACPENALSKRKGGGVILHKDKCTGCKNCVTACLVGAIHMDGDEKAIICKHCGICPPFCPHGVLEMWDVVDTDALDEGAASCEG